MQFNKVYRFYSDDFLARISTVLSTKVVQEVCTIQEAGPVGATALARLVTGTILLASHLKEGHSLAIRMVARGPLGEISAEASYEGKVRAYCQNPEYIPSEVPWKLSDAVGNGVLSVAHHTPHQKHAHVSLVPLMTGEVGEDLAYYLMQSKQIRSVISLGTYMDQNGQVAACGGVLIELFPEATDAHVEKTEKAVRAAPPLSQLLAQRLTPEQMAEAYTHKELSPLPHDYNLELFCTCSMERVERMLLLMGKKEIQWLIHQSKPANIECEFCGKAYQIKEPVLKELYEKAASEPTN